jgi:hypothetical protein
LTVIEGQADLASAVAVATDGVVILNALSRDGVDPYYPAVYGKVTNTTAVLEGVDECLGHPTSGSLYHYHFLSPCLANPNMY